MSDKDEREEREDTLGDLDEIGLSIGTRINYPFLLGKQIVTWQNSIVKGEGIQSPQEILEAALGLYQMIPDQWRIQDKDFDKEVEASVTLTRIDTRQIWCGVPVGRPRFRIIPKFNPYKLFHACVNLLARRGMLAKTLYEEIAPGIKFKELEETQMEEEDKANESTTS